MILAIDIGNSKTAFGIFYNDILTSQHRISSTPIQSIVQYWNELQLCCQSIKTSPQQIKGIVIASVVPNIQDRVITMISQYLSINPVIVSGKLDPGITIHYDDPATLGADRICNVVAAYKKFGGPAIVVSLGTATTYDVIASNGDFLGGVIAPGIMTAGASLNQMTAQLPHTELAFPTSTIRKDTATSIQAGIAFGAVEGMEGIIRRIRSELGSNATVIVTGGLAEFISPYTKIFSHIEPSLVLQGAYLIYQRVTKSR